MTHTPTPWAYEDPMGPELGFWLVQDGLQPYEWSCIAIVCGDNDRTKDEKCRFITEDEQRANAAFIVKAVNAHDKLVEALRAMVEYIGPTDTWHKLKEAKELLENIDASK